MLKVSFIGLGVMGYPMAGHLSKEGHEVTVYNRTSYKAKKWLNEYKGFIAETPKEASFGSDFIFICVGNDDDVLSVINGNEGIIAGLSPGSIVVDHTTASAELAKNLFTDFKNVNKRSNKCSIIMNNLRNKTLNKTMKNINKFLFDENI